MNKSASVNFDGRNRLLRDARVMRTGRHPDMPQLAQAHLAGMADPCDDGAAPVRVDDRLQIQAGAV